MISRSVCFCRFSATFVSLVCTFLGKDQFTSELLMFWAFHAGKAFVRLSDFAIFTYYILYSNYSYSPLWNCWLRILKILLSYEQNQECWTKSIENHIDGSSTSVRYYSRGNGFFGFTDLARKVLTKVWKYTKKDKLSAELRANVDENYARMFVWLEITFIPH